MKNYRLSRGWFSIDNFFDMRDTKIRKMTPSCLPRRAGPEYVLFYLKDQSQNLTSGQVRSGQGKVMTQVAQYAKLPMRIDEPSCLAPFARLYLYPVARYWQKKTDCDLI